MRNFGDKLRHERECRNMPLADIAKRTRIGIQYLEALERNEFSALPGPRGFGKFYIRAYAEVLGFDPESLITEFDIERNKDLRTEADTSAPSPTRRRRIQFKPRERAARPAASPGEPVAHEQATQPVEQQPELDESPPRDSSGIDSDTNPPLAFPPRTDPAEAAAPQAVQRPARPKPRPRSLAWITALVVVAIVLLAFMLRPKPEESAVARAGSNPVSPAVGFEMSPETPEPLPLVPNATLDSEEFAAAASLASSPAKATSPTRAVAPLTVVDFGLGRGVANRQIVSPGTEFEQGSVVSFLTHVQGGVAGQTIAHAWIREGRLVQSIELTLGGPRWRTYSNKTLGRAGAWAVEARDAQGNVLARVEFNGSPKSSKAGE